MENIGFFISVLILGIFIFEFYRSEKEASKMS